MMKEDKPKKFGLKSPLNAQFELTFACPSLCSHCYNYWRYLEEKEMVKIEKELGPHHFLSIADKIAEAEIFSITLTGGEPLLRRDILYGVIERLNSKNVETNINSNLMLITDEDLARMESLQVGGFLTSFHTYDEEKFDKISNLNGAFRKTIRGISLVRRNKRNPSTNMVVSQINKGDVYQTGKFLYSNFGIKRFSATPINPCTNAKAHLDMRLSKEETIETLEDLVRLEQDLGISTEVLEPIPYCLIYDNPSFEKFMKKTCTAGKSTIAIDPTANVRACIHLTKNYGSLLEESLEDIWGRMAEWRQSGYYPDECKSCSVIDKCKGACRSEAESVYGDITSRPPLMTSPLDTKLESTHQNTEISLKGFDNSYLTTNNVRYRKEHGGYILFSPSKKYLFLNQGEFEALTELTEKQTFKLSDLLPNTDQNDHKITNFLKKMVGANIIVPKEEKIK
ncbi:MAG: radical SAM protein [Candidatus Woesearchaeota archaeon]